MTIPAALYVMPRSVYRELLPPDRCWDEARDAKLYEGPWPVVAHPPCGPWGRLRGMCTRQDPTCGPRAVEQVRAYGGVLEHPAYSRLWDECRLPKPVRPSCSGIKFTWPHFDEFGGHSFEVNQVAWGHSCRKPTWLYVVGIPYYRVLEGIRTGGVATHMVATGPRIARRLPVATKRAKSATPRAFAEWLISLASIAVPQRRAA